MCLRGGNSSTQLPLLVTAKAAVADPCSWCEHTLGEKCDKSFFPPRTSYANGAMITVKVSWAGPDLGETEGGFTVLTSWTLPTRTK